jgi:hypothetical protein
MSNNVKNGIIVAIAMLVLASVMYLFAANVNFDKTTEFAKNIVVDHSNDITNDIKLSLEEYNFQKEHCLRTYKIDVHENYDKYLTLSTDSLTNEITRKAEIYVGDAYEELFKNYDNTVLLANVSTKYNHNFQSKEEFYTFCVNSIIYETLTEITKQINVETIIKY